MTTPRQYDLYSPQMKADPYPTYAEMREEPPIYVAQTMEGGPAWFISCYDDIAAILSDSNRFVVDAQTINTTEADEALPEILQKQRDLIGPSLPGIDPPEHTKLRALVKKAFLRTRVEDMRPQAQRMADALLDQVQDSKSMDLINDFAYPLPISIIGEMLDIPQKERDQFREWSNIAISIPTSQVEAEHNLQALTRFAAYLQKFIAHKTQHPGQDLVSALIQAEETGRKLNKKELLGTTFLLITAGFETTVSLICNGVLALLQNPAQRQLLQQNPTLITTAVDEFIRFDGPVERMTRWANEDFELKGKAIKRGSRLVLVTAAANRDPDKFEHPNQLDISRGKNKHLGFGMGIHYCIGGSLARMEGEVAIGTLLRRLPNLQLAIPVDQISWRYRSVNLRSMEIMPVKWA